jgi:ParB/RepB/Spo0J family partition protein
MAKLGSRWENRPISPHLGKIAKLVDEGRHVGEGSLTRIPLDQIQLDPEQPRTELRQFGVTPESILAHRRGEIDLADPADAQRCRHFMALNELAQSIKRHKLIHPIGVYRDDRGATEGYIIAEGERRFLAHLLLGEVDIRAIVQPMPTQQKERKARQLVENIVREDLSTAERVQALRHLDALHQREAGTAISAAELVEMLGISERQADTYLTVLNAPADVLAAVLDRRLTNLDKASAIAKLPSAVQREKTIAALEKGLGFPMARKVAAPRVTTRGRPMLRISLGATKKGKAVQAVMKGYLGEAQLAAQYGDVDWSDMASVSRAWIMFWNDIEKSVG